MGALASGFLQILLVFAQRSSSHHQSVLFCGELLFSTLFCFIKRFEQFIDHITFLNGKGNSSIQSENKQY